ncbi:hypothetical protein M5K25_025384 [Dendrobium thyrsiflorum]|uniref:Uncharacterized protein n=1 Tax=Dendrobium thyrsiflorum TaxID=117978 RepID=A0ABD0U3Z4_DENTH
MPLLPPDYRLTSDLHRTTNDALTSAGPPSDTLTSAGPPNDVGPPPDHQVTPLLPLDYILRPLRHPLRTTCFRPPSPENGLSDLYRPSTTVLTTYFVDNGPFDLRRPLTTVFPTSVTRRLRSFRPFLPTMVLPTSVTRQRGERRRKRNLRPLLSPSSFLTTTGPPIVVRPPSDYRQTIDRLRTSVRPPTVVKLPAGGPPGHQPSPDFYPATDRS